MPSNRALLIDIDEFGLDPKKNHSKTKSDGRLVRSSDVSSMLDSTSSECSDSTPVEALVQTCSKHSEFELIEQVQTEHTDHTVVDLIVDPSEIQNNVENSSDRQSDVLVEEKTLLETPKQTDLSDSSTKNIEKQEKKQTAKKKKPDSSISKKSVKVQASEE